MFNLKKQDEITGSSLGESKKARVSHKLDEVIIAEDSRQSKKMPTNLRSFLVTNKKIITLIVVVMAIGSIAYYLAIVRSANSGDENGNSGTTGQGFDDATLKQIEERVTEDPEKIPNGQVDYPGTVMEEYR